MLIFSFFIIFLIEKSIDKNSLKINFNDTTDVELSDVKYGIGSLKHLGLPFLLDAHRILFAYSYSKNSIIGPYRCDIFFSFYFPTRSLMLFS